MKIIRYILIMIFISYGQSIFGMDALRKKQEQVAEMQLLNIANNLLKKMVSNRVLIMEQAAFIITIPAATQEAQGIYDTYLKAEITLRENLATLLKSNPDISLSIEKELNELPQRAIESYAQSFKEIVLDKYINPTPESIKNLDKEWKAVATLNIQEWTGDSEIKKFAIDYFKAKDRAYEKKIAEVEKSKGESYFSRKEHYEKPFKKHIEYMKERNLQQPPLPQLTKKEIDNRLAHFTIRKYEDKDKMANSYINQKPVFYLELQKELKKLKQNDEKSFNDFILVVKESSEPPLMISEDLRNKIKPDAYPQLNWSIYDGNLDLMAYYMIKQMIECNNISK